MKFRLFFLVILTVAVTSIGCRDNGMKPGPIAEPVTVMTWNIYVGTDVDYVIAAPSPEEIPVRAAEAFQLLLDTNFPERAQAIAKQIAKHRPHLVGLQEISLIRRQSPGDAVVGGTTPAEEVLYDYLAILLEAIEAEGGNYSVAGIIQNTDAEVPMIVSQNPLQFDDIRLTDFDVVLARNNVSVSRVTEANYASRLTVPGLGLEILRGYVAIDAEVDDKKYRFINTHLEPRSSGEEIQMAQAQELIAAMENETLPVILVGDLNTRPESGNTYQLLNAAGFVDVWPLNSIEDNPDGFTSPHDLDLRNEEIRLNQRIDLILVLSQEGIKSVEGEVIGDELADRTVSGLWPSDHAGVTAELRFRH